MLPAHDYKINNEKRHALAKGAIKVKIVFVFGFLLVGLVFTQLVFANNLATDGQKLSNVQQEIRHLESENTTLKAEIAKTSALTNLSAKAQGLGFKKPAKLTIL
jgi:cell division protein FtsB